MCQPYSKLKLRCAFKADWPDWDIDEDSFSRWADLDIDCPLLVTMMKEHETELIERGDFDPDEWGTDETTLFDGVHLHIDGGHIVYHQPDWGADIEFTNVPKTIGEAFDNFIDTFWEEFPDTDTDELEELLRNAKDKLIADTNSFTWSYGDCAWQSDAAFLNEEDAHAYFQDTFQLAQVPAEDIAALRTALAKVRSCKAKEIGDEELLRHIEESLDERHIAFSYPSAPGDTTGAYERYLEVSIAEP